MFECGLGCNWGWGYVLIELLQTNYKRQELKIQVYIKDKRFMQSVQSKNQMIHRESTNKGHQQKLGFYSAYPLLCNVCNIIRGQNYY